MPTNLEIFHSNLALPADDPPSLEIIRAEGMYLYDQDGKKYIDLNSGICVNNLGHQHPKVQKAIKDQLDKFSHVMVYGQMLLDPQLQLTKTLTDLLPDSLSCSYFVSSGSEAVEGSLKLAKRYTRRSKIIACNKAYHGSTQGALSIMGREYFKQAFRPLLPDVHFIEFNNQKDIELIDEKTACVVIEAIQGGTGVITPENGYLKAVKDKCTEVGALMILDEIQTGVGRTGTMFAFEQYDFVPDILLLAKALGGGMPLGAFISSKEIMDKLKTNPVLGHITTFGGHPVCCAAAVATLEAIQNENILEAVKSKGELFKQLLIHEKIKEVRGEGLMIAVDLGETDYCQEVIRKCISSGLFLDWFLFADHCIRLSPPLIINEEEIKDACHKILEAL
ncbi:MAG: aspartate aminotransferase family protein [Flavobacteriales bacterium]|nr:MAG: aspartate aminotransferase family protein [Flavobacteriales bacterium]